MISSELKGGTHVNNKIYVYLAIVCLRILLYSTVRVPQPRSVFKSLSQSIKELKESGSAWMPNRAFIEPPKGIDYYRDFNTLTSTTITSTTLTPAV